MCRHSGATHSKVATIEGTYCRADIEVPVALRELQLEHAGPNTHKWM